MRVGAWLVLALATGCNGQSEARLGDNAGGSAGEAGSAGTGGDAGSAGTGGSAGSDPQCERNDDPNPFEFLVRGPNDAELPASFYSRGGDLTLRGTVHGVDTASFGVEGCGSVEAKGTGAGGANGDGGGGGGGAGGTEGDCDSDLWTIEATGTDLVIPIETEMRVSVAYTSRCQPFSGCNTTLIVRDELADGESLLLGMHIARYGGTTGEVLTPLAWPVTMRLIDLECFMPVPSGGMPFTWALSMEALAVPESSVLLHMGESGELSLNAADDTRWVARNVHSYDVGGYDATTRLKFYLAKRR